MKLQTRLAFSRVFLIFVLFFSCLVIRAQANNGTPVHKSKLFTQQKICPDKAIGLDRCPESVSAEAATRCSVRCGQQSWCAGFLWDPVQEVCHLCTEFVASDCSSNTQDRGTFKAFELLQICDGSGTPSPTNRCSYRDCNDVSAAGYPDGVYWIRPSVTEAAFEVKCGMTWKRTYLMLRLTSSFDFYRGWDDYVNGFGDPSTDHWLGLKHMSVLTRSQFSYCLLLELILANNYYYQAWYKPVTIEDASQNFTLRFDTVVVEDYSHFMGDCLSDVKGRPFSTYDADHDGNITENCAARHQSGWWLGSVSGSGCTLCNPTGRLLQPSDMKTSDRDDEVFWTPLGDGSAAPRDVSMWLQRC